MVIDISYWTRVIKNIIYVILILLGLYFAFKLSIFYMPFLIAFIISLIVEPTIKFIMKKTKLTRRSSSIIIFIIVASFILGGLAWILITLFSEASSLLQGLNNYIDKAYIQIQAIINNFDFNKIYLSDEILNVIQNSTGDFLETASNWLRNALTGLIGIITSLPTIAICIGITVVALYFICVDKIYILDQIEHHIPELWVKKIGTHLRDLIKTLGAFLKAQATLILITFFILLIGLNILKLLNFNIQYPLLIALLIGFIDALPILGAGTVLIPWAILSTLNNDWNLGIALIVLSITISLTRQILEPKLISKNIGVHPIFTLIAMYTGFKIIGVIGLLLGPIILIIFKNIFASLIDQGVFKTIFNQKWNKRDRGKVFHFTRKSKQKLDFYLLYCEVFRFNTMSSKILEEVITYHFDGLTLTIPVFPYIIFFEDDVVIPSFRYALIVSFSHKWTKETYEPLTLFKRGFLCC